MLDSSYITTDQQKVLQEIYQINPLLFDFVGKRMVVSPNTGKGYLPCVFSWNEALFGPRETFAGDFARRAA